MALCQNCGKREAVTGCEVCGSQVCESCDLSYGCKVCGGGKKSF